MKKTNCFSKLAMALIFGGAAFAANAQNAIEEGVAFKPEANTVYEFTPSMDGNLTITVNSDAYFMYMQNWDYLLYSDAEHDSDSGIRISGYTEVSSDLTEYNYQDIEAGKTYYFYTTIYTGVDCTFTMTEYKGEGIAKVTPSPQNPFNYVVMPDILIYGTSSIAGMGNASVKYGSETVELNPKVYTVDINGGNGRYFIQITGVAFQQLANTIANSGEKSFTITIENVTTDNGEVVVNESGEEAVSVDNGTVSITYNVFPAAQYMPEASTWPSPFYSYWEVNDPNGIATLVFDQEIASVGEVTLMMGHFNEGDITEMDNYDLTDNVKINGKEVFVDFTGVSRPSGASEVTVIVQNVRGVNGISANMGNSPSNLVGTLFKYLDFSNEAAPENPGIPDDPEEPGDTDSIATIGADSAGQQIFNLNGVKVNENNLGKGVYIINGKKVIVK